MASTEKAADLDPLGWTGLEPASGTADKRTQFWLQCTDTGWFHTAGELRPQSVDLSYFDSACQALFGRAIGDVGRNNALFGGARPASSGLFFVAPEGDPWAGLSAESDNGTVGNRVIRRNNTHCFDLKDMATLQTRTENLSRDIQMLYMPVQKCQTRVNGRCKCNRSATGFDCGTRVTGMNSFETVAKCSVFVTTAILLIIGGSVWYWGRGGDDNSTVRETVYT
jgi:hypothetical protein